MRRLIPAAALVAVALLTAAILSASGSAQQSGDRTFTLVERLSEASFHFVNNPPRGDRSPFEGGPLSPGDGFLFHQALRNRTGNRRVGALDVTCNATVGGRNFGRARFVCTGVYSLARGTITAVAFIGRGGQKIAVTGGTGVYEGATGSIKSTERRGGSVDVFHLLG